jgi:hypothetical protein
MVHALEEVQRLLKSTGRLIDIQPLIEAPLLQVHKENTVVFVEPDPSYDYEEDLKQADATLTQVIQRGLLVIEERSEFDFLTHGSSAQELLAFWDKASADDDISEDLAEQRRNQAGSRTGSRGRFARERAHPSA